MKTRPLLYRLIIQQHLLRGLFISFLTLLSFNSYSQGGWNIGLILTDSIGQEHIGKKIKIDFKSISGRHEKQQNSIWAVRRPDTLQIQTQHGTFGIIEVRKTGADYGYWKDQHFLLKEISTGKTFDVWESEILEIRDSLIYFKLRVKDNPDSFHKFLWIDKKYLDGLLIVR